MSSREVICDRMEPVRTQMKLYGIKPERLRSDQCALVCLWRFVLPLFCNALCVSSPISTEKKKMDRGMLRTGQVMLRNQLGVMGKKRRKRRKKNRLF